MIKDFIKDDGEHIVFNGELLELYIPMSFFEGKLGENYGSSIRVFGIFNARVFNNKKPGKLETFNYPSMIILYPTDIREETLTLVEGKTEPDKYLVATFIRDSKIMRNKIPQDSSNVELFIDLITRGKIPVTVPYSKVLSVWLKNLEINNVGLQVVSSVLECILAQFYRDGDKPNLRFGQSYGKNPKIGEYAYSTANIRELCSRNSTFTALTFEDMDAMITTSLNISKYNKEEIDSPLEKILKM